MRNSLQKMAALLFCVSAVMADVSSLSKGYLPPEQSGYNYDAPSVPFPSAGPSYPSPAPSYPSQAPSYRPPATITQRPPIYSTPSYPTQPPYRPSYSTPKPPQYGGGSGYAEEGSAVSPVSNPGAGLGGGEFDHLQQPHVPGMPFDFNYAVKDEYFGTDYGHQATSNGDQVRGEYRVQLPDGRLQIVKYVADWKDGYTAEVTYQGEAQYPTGPSSSGSGIGAGGYPAPIKPQPSPGYPQPSPGYPKPSPGYPQPSPAYPSPSPAYPSPSPAYPSYPQPSPAYPSPSPSYPSFPQKPSGSYPKPGSGSSFGGSQQVPVSTGYPSGVPSSGYPSGLPSGGYPSGLPSSGYPSSSPTAGYPSKPSSGYGQPSNFVQQGSYVAPSQGQISGYGGSQQSAGGYSSPAPSYSSGPDYGGY